MTSSIKDSLIWLMVEDIRARFQKAEDLLDGIEPSLRDFVIINGVGNQLIDEIIAWDEPTHRPRLHRGGVDVYTFGRQDPMIADPMSYSPMRVIRWVEEGECFLLNIFFDKMQEFKLWSTVGSAPFGQPRLERTQSLHLPISKADLDLILSNNYRLLKQAPKIS